MKIASKTFLGPLKKRESSKPNLCFRSLGLRWHQIFTTTVASTKVQFLRVTPCKCYSA